MCKLLIRVSGRIFNVVILLEMLLLLLFVNMSIGLLFRICMLPLHERFVCCVLPAYVSYVYISRKVFNVVE